MTLSPGTRLGPYEILAPIGAGGMGEVYRARDKKLDRDVAVKVLPESVAADPDALKRFEREAKAVAALSHPHILSIFDFGTHGGISYAVTELLEGETLREKLVAGPIREKQALDYGLQTAKGLAAAHERGVVHRDLKPENIFITRDGHLKILDFGLAKRVEAVTRGEETEAATVSGLTEPGTVMGTVGYMSPEQVRGHPVDHRSDIFSFGAILYELVSGKRAFKRDTAADTMSAILKEEPPALAGKPGLPSGLAAIVARCLEKSPEERFQSARDLALDLKAIERASEAPVPVAAPVRLRRVPVLGAAFTLLLEGAVEALRKSVDLDPAVALTNLGLFYSAQGRHAEAIAAADESVARRPAPGPALALQASVYAAAGRKQEARAQLAVLEDPASSIFFPKYLQALAYTALGDKDRAIALLEKGFGERSLVGLVLKRLPGFDPLRSDPRFADLLRRMGLPPDDLPAAARPTKPARGAARPTVILARVPA